MGTGTQPSNRGAAEGEAPDISVLVCTFNRCSDLRAALESALTQETGGAFTFEVVVVDNNSTDDTRRVVEDLAQGHAPLRYVLEPEQGVCHARTRGLSEIRGSIYTVTDDDLVLPQGWLRTVWEVFQSHPEVSVVGGKVLPLWRRDPPAWLTPEHWSPLALLDSGDTEFIAGPERPVCLLAGAYRIADVRAVGGYRPGLGASGARIGGVDDADLFSRLWESGYRGLYTPRLAVHHKVEAERVTKAYHRRWHTGHGRFIARMREGGFERAAAHPMGVPTHVYRQAAEDAIGWLRHQARGDSDAAFLFELRLRFFAGFFAERRSEATAGRLNGSAEAELG